MFCHCIPHLVYLSTYLQLSRNNKNIIKHNIIYYKQAKDKSYNYKHILTINTPSTRSDFFKYSYDSSPPNKLTYS